MKEQQPATVLGFFGVQPEELPAQLEAAVEGTGVLTALKAMLHAQAARLDWSIVLETLAGELGKILDAPLSEILVTAWESAGLLLEHANEAGESTTLLALAEHSLSSNHKPTIEIVVNAKPLATLEVTIDLTLDLAGAVVKIEDRKITEIHVGNVSGSGQVSCGGSVLFERKSGPIPIPGVLIPDPGIELSRV